MFYSFPTAPPATPPASNSAASYCDTSAHLSRAAFSQPGWSDAQGDSATCIYTYREISIIVSGFTGGGVTGVVVESLAAGVAGQDLLVKEAEQLPAGGVPGGRDTGGRSRWRRSSLRRNRNHWRKRYNEPHHFLGASWCQHRGVLRVLCI
ncbi:hypothetical protein BGX38DRAFT_1142633 [Terfezia claveryi]|nr:hypothetical protein BGX38DRAFT_1142633 [Terfezia claveryi]